jgi:DNA polymerase III delta prime subunit
MEEETTNKRPLLSEILPTDHEDHLLMSDEQWDRQKKYVKNLVATTMGYKTSIPYESDYMHITTSSGQTLYATLEADDYDPDSYLYDMKHAKFQGNLLGVPISTIKSLVEAEEREERMKKLESSSVQDTTIFVAGSKLWVDKYSPKSFTDLLSEEFMNRKVLVWLKEWSGTVFGKPFVNPLPNRFQPKGQNGAPAPTTPLEPKDRPDQLCILVSGPPGIGKTTLAHIIARTAGFEPVEFNASDDRTASTFMPKVMDVIDTESRFGSGKPKALIIDEIDGVVVGEGKGAIDALAKLLDEKKLKRPIICICNDVWAPSLRPLRDRSMQIRLEPPSIQSLVSRLEFVCNTEGVSIDTQILQVLCELTNRDIRSCLNTLQFLSRKANHITPELFATTSFGNKDMTTNIFDVWKNVFQKEEERSTALQALLDSATRFHQLKQLSRGNSSTSSSLLRSSKPEDRSSTLKPNSSLERIHAMVKGNNSDKVLDGVHENVLLVKYHDPLLKHTVALADWFQFYDELSSQVKAKQLFQLSTYIPYVASAAHVLCSTTTKHDSLYPRQSAMARATTHVNAATIQQFQSGILAPLRPFLDLPRIVLDFASFLIRILAPNIRPVNVALLTPDEKARLTSLVAVHLAYGISYLEASSQQLDYPEDEEKLAMWRKRAEQLRGQTNLQIPRFELTSHLFGLNPPIHRITHFTPLALTKKQEGKSRSSSIPDFDAASDTVRQVVSSQLHTERLRRLESKAGIEHILFENIDPQPASSKAKSAAKLPSSAKKVVDIEADIVHVDFFGRKIEPKIKPKPAGTDVEEPTKSTLQLYYKYHEGKTDAVRRRVLIKDLL